MNSTHLGPARRLLCLAISISTLAVLAGCSSNSANTAGTNVDTGSTTPGASDVSLAGSASPADTAAPNASSSDATPTPQKLPGGGGPDDPCGLVAASDVQTVLPGAPEGVATLPEAVNGAISVSSCSYHVDQRHFVLIQMETGPSQMMESAKAAAAEDTDMTAVDGLGDAGYASSSNDGANVVFYVGNTQVMIVAAGQPDGKLLTDLAKKVAAGL